MRKTKFKSEAIKTSFKNTFKPSNVYNFQLLKKSNKNLKNSASKRQENSPTKQSFS